MSNGLCLPYQLRPNKAVDRELFIGLLSRIAAELQIENYRYVGLGGPFLEDFRLVHTRLAIGDLVCVESNENVHRRQKFNRPVDKMQCVHDSIEDYIDSTNFTMPVIIWFDYTDPSNLASQIEVFSRAIVTVPLNSVLRVTLNANPQSSLGKPSLDILASIDLHQWRLNRFRCHLGNLFPNNLNSNDMRRKNFGKSLLMALRIAADKEVLSLASRRIVWALATHYADGQPMVTATLIVCSKDNEVSIETLVRGWEYWCTPDTPKILDMPALSTLERLTMESFADPRKQMGFELPRSDMNEDPCKSFKMFYRVFPHFLRVQL